MPLTQPCAENTADFSCARCRQRVCLDTGRPCARVEALLPRAARRRAPRALLDTDRLIRGENCRLPRDLVRA